MFVGQKSVNTACAAFASLTSFSSPKQDATASMSACVFFFFSKWVLLWNTPSERQTNTTLGQLVSPRGTKQRATCGCLSPQLCLVTGKPLDPDTRDPPPLLCDSIAVCFFGERLSSATSLLAPTPPVPLLPLSSRTHCSEWKVNTATASSAGPSFVWPAQIKCFALPRRRTAAFSSSCQCQLWQI